VQTQVIMNCSALPCLLALLVNPKKSIRKEACWTISNITAGNEAQIEFVIAANIIPPLVAILKEEDFDIQKEAAWAISNATSGGSDAQIRYLAHQGVIPRLCDLFACPDSKIIMVAMEGVENILRVGKADGERAGDNHNQYADMVEQCDGWVSLESLALQEHAMEHIRSRAAHIRRSYLAGAVEDEEVQL